jgi:hypothetical protein
MCSYPTDRNLLEADHFNFHMQQDPETSMQRVDDAFDGVRCMMFHERLGLENKETFQKIDNNATRIVLDMRRLWIPLVGIVNVVGDETKQALRHKQDVAARNISQHSDLTVPLESTTAAGSSLNDEGSSSGDSQVSDIELTRAGGRSPDTNVSFP